MKWRLAARTITVQQDLPIAGLALGDPGFFNFDKWDHSYLEAFELRLGFAFNSSAASDVVIELVDPDPGYALAPTVVVFDTVTSGVGPITSMYEDNLGQGWPVPMRYRASVLPYELSMQAAGMQGEGCFQVFLWWEPKFPSVRLWKFLCQVPELFAGMARSPVDEVAKQLAADPLFSLVAKFARQGRLPTELQAVADAMGEARADSPVAVAYQHVKE